VSSTSHASRRRGIAAGNQRASIGVACVVPKARFSSRWTVSLDRTAEGYTLCLTFPWRARPENLGAAGKKYFTNSSQEPNVSGFSDSVSRARVIFLLRVSWK
jgi:hypothetical protein